jgi:2-polyprenyl-6-methoxyphenol hydroxylase-like FAD-dependent oxidoreductase
VYVATLPLDGETGTDFVMYNTPGRSVAVHPARGRPIAAFMFRAPQIPHFDHRDLDQHKRLLCDAYAGAGWRVPELLDRVIVADDLYFDSVSRIEVPTWSRGRIGLVGDAASCVSLFGDGSSLAMIGAFTLADSLGDDIPIGTARLRGSAPTPARGQGELGHTGGQPVRPRDAGGHRGPQHRRSRHAIGRQDPRNCIP